MPVVMRRPGPVLVLVVLIGALLRIAPWLRANVFLGVQESDDGVYYGAASLLLDGQLPYTDYTIVHPPGVSLLLLPFAALGDLAGHDVGLASARVAMVVVAVANILLVHRLALRLPATPERRQGAALVAAALYALMPDAVIAEHTVLLEPLVSLFCLLAVSVLTGGERVTPRRAFLSGLLCVVAVSVKLFAGAYVLVILGWLVAGRRHALRGYLAGLVGGTAVLVAPFFALSPSGFVHDVVVTQLRRPADATDSGLYRVVDMLGLASVGVVAGTLVVLALVVLLSRARPSGLWGSLLALGVVAFSTSPSYFPHYGAFLAPALALAAHRLVATVDPRTWVRRGSAVTVGVLLVVFTVGSVVHDARTRGQDDWSQAGRLIEPGSCVFYELTSYALAAGVFAPPTADCPAWVDGRGVAYTQNTDWPSSRDFYFDGFVEDAVWQQEMREQLRRADYVLVGESPEVIPEWDAETRAYVLGGFVRLRTFEGPGHAAGELWGRRSP